MAKTSSSPNSPVAPSADEARQAFAAALGPDMRRLRDTLSPLRTTAPQVLLLEGGTERSRAALARWWAALLNCEAPHAEGPCLQCASCLQVGAGIHWNIRAFDGRISNKEDEESPGPVRAFNMDNVRALKTQLRDAPHGSGLRVVLLAGLDLTRDEAANALLKALEEPSAHTVFVLLAPQREQLLPTLVSRSWVLTLPWPPTLEVEAELEPWLEALSAFMAHGRSWLTLTSAKGAVDPALARRILLACQKNLSLALGGHSQAAPPLARHFAALSPQGRAAASELFFQAQEALQYNVNPVRVLDWTATQLHVLFR